MSRTFDCLAGIVRSWLRPGKAAVKSYELGLEHAVQESWSDAADHFAFAVRLTPGIPAWHCTHGNALIKLKRWNHALDAFELALRRKKSLSNETRVSAEAGCGICFMSLNKWSAAEGALARAMALGRRNAKIQFQYGTCLFKLGRITEAVEVLEKSARKKPGNCKCVALLDIARLRMNSEAEPQKGKSRAAPQGISEPERQTGGYEEARVHAKRAARLTKKHDFSRAAEAYRVALAIHPGEVRWHVALADVLLRLKPGTLIRPALGDTHLISYSGKAHDVLYVIFSPVIGRHIFGTIDFKGDTLMLAEERLTYYTYNLSALLSHLKSIITDNGYQKVCMMGSSKGAYGALWASAWCARELPKVDFLVLAFSPQTSLYPCNENIHSLPSYENLRKMAAASTSVGEDFQTYGSLEWLGELRLTNIEGKVFYGADLLRDAVEAERLKDVTHLRITPIPNYPFHGTAALFTKQRESLRRLLIGAEPKTADDAYFNREGSEQMVDEFLKNLDPANYTMDALLNPWRQKPNSNDPEGV